MISTQNKHSGWISDFEEEQESDGLDLRSLTAWDSNEYRKGSTINIITKKQIVYVRRQASNSEQLEDIAELSMKITTYDHGSG